MDRIISDMSNLPLILCGAFALVKLACYLVILVILLLDSTRALFFM